MNVKKKLVYFFSFFYLFATTGFNQLLKLSLLLGHYLEHQCNAKEITIYQFVYIHDSHGDVRDADNAKDMKLSFKTHENCTNFINTLVSQSFLLVGHPLCSAAKKVKHLFIDEILTFFFQSSIWQPPQFAQAFMYRFKYIVFNS